MNRNLWLAAALVGALSGCIFQGNDPVEPGFDLGETNGSPDMSGGDLGTSDPADTNDEDDATQPDTGPVIDMAEPPDQGTDLGAPDMGPPPFRLLDEFVLDLGEPPLASAPPQITMFAQGFLAGYTSTMQDARVAYVAPNRPPATDILAYPAGNVGVDLAGNGQVGFMTIVQPQRQTVVRVTADANSALQAETDFFQTTNNEVVFHEMAIAMERDLPYIGEVRQSSGWHVDLGVWGVNGYGTASDMLGFELHDLEAIGAGSTAPNRRVLVAGNAGGGYSLLDFHWDGNVWNNVARGCGPAPAADGATRIVPIRQQWTLLRRASLSGPTLQLVRCAPSGMPLVEHEISTPLSGVVVDFDIAEESVPLGQIGLAWVKADGVYFALAEVHEDRAPGLQRVWQIPDADGYRVRAAFNAITQTFAVVVQQLDGAKVYIFEIQ